MASCLNPSDILSSKYVNIPIVFDLTIEKSNNYFLDCGKPVLVHNSTKTWSIIQLFIVKMLEKSGMIITATRKTSPSLKTSVIRDFVDILKDLNLYSIENHNKTDRIYKLNNNIFEFVSADDPQKKRGTKRTHLWMNETNEFTYEDFFQFMIRTTGKIFFDYNPSDEYSWIYDKILPRNDSIIIKSNYEDNPFLEQTIIDEIERLKYEDPNYWKIYGLGEIGKRKSIIYDNWEIIDKMPEPGFFDEERGGVDYGFNNPNVLVRVGRHDVYNMYVDEQIYESRLTNNKFIDKIKLLNLWAGEKRRKIIADSASPDKIEEMNNAGLHVEPCKKGEGSVKNGIDLVNRTKLFVTASSTNIIKELKSYKWKEDKEGKILDEPLAFNDHGMDAVRYAISDMIFPSDIAIKILGRQVEEKTIHIASGRAQRERATIRKASIFNR